MRVPLEELAARLSRLCPPATASVPPAGAAPGEAPAAPAVAPAPAPVLAFGCHLVDYAARGYHLDASVPPDQVVEAARLLDEAGFALDAVTGVDWLAQEQMEVVYDYFHPAAPCRVGVRCRLPRQAPEVATISTVFAGANWHERETHDFFGIKFLGHPDLTPFLLPEDADYHPLRKDFVA